MSDQLHIEFFGLSRKGAECGASGETVSVSKLAEVTCSACLKAAALWYQKAFHDEKDSHRDCGVCDED